MNCDLIKKAWDEEYKRKGIPSSYRKDPTRTVVEFIAWMKRKDLFEIGMAADIGCGQGRNSFFLAKQGYSVTGIELLEDNVVHVNAFAQAHDISLRAYAQDAASDWPIDINSLDIAIDVFCYKHIINKNKQAKYRQELWKALKADGLYFISLASERDGFYGPLLETSPHPSEKLIIDPYSTIPSYLYSKHDLETEFADLFELLQIEEQVSVSPMYEKEYSRVVVNAIFKKKIKL